MVIKLKEGCLVNLDNIKVAQVTQNLAGSWIIEISYYDDKKNPKAFIRCESQEEGSQLVDKLLKEIEDANTVKISRIR